jgi:hypothetical protein
VIVRLLLACLLLVAPAAAASLDIDLDAYRTNREAGAMGTVAGRAYEEPQRRADVDHPLPDVAVTLVPRSEDFLARLGAIKERMRNDVRFYRQSGPAIIQARRDLERALTGAGAGNLVRFTTVGPDGRYEVSLPAGAWVAMAHRSVFNAKPSSPPKLRYQGHDIFALEPPVIGYYAVTVWLREVAVARGEAATVDFNDRNVWVTAIEEKRNLDADPWSAPRR